MSEKATRRVLWAALLLALPVPYWVLEGGRAPTIWLLEVAGYSLAALLAEGGSIVALISGLFLVEATLAVLGLRLVAGVVASAIERRISPDRRTIAVALFAGALLIGSLFPIYATPLVEGGRSVNLFGIFA
jgi:hypothetical protein